MPEACIAQTARMHTYVGDKETDFDAMTRLLLAGQSSQTRVHSSMYQALRTNLPRHVMAFSDLPFDAETTAGEDERLFPGHQEVNI